MLTACVDSISFSQIETSATQSQTSSESYIKSESQSPAESSASTDGASDAATGQEAIEYYPFILPKIEHIYKGEMVQLINEFSVEALFPEFQIINHLDYSSRNVSTNIFWLAYDCNDELILQGKGISHEDLKAIEEMVVAKFPEDQRYPAHRTVRRDDMTMIGREYFGEQFEFPVSLITPEITHLDEESKYYIFSSWRFSGLPPINYILFDVIQKDNAIFATFLPFVIEIDPLDNMIYSIRFFNFIESRYNYHILFEEHIEFQPEIEPSYYLNYVRHLPVPQEQLGTITVTFRRENDGRLIATSSRYNREDH